MLSSTLTYQLKRFGGAMTRADNSSSDTSQDLPDTQRLGRLGEHVAVRHIVGLGWQVVCRNWSHPRGEIDIIARDTDDHLVFIEVRTRRGASAMLRALESVDTYKQERLRLLVQAYLAEQDTGPDTSLRVDVIGVSLEKDGRYQVELVRDALGW